jgi:TP901 family phage tail tape measure protein
MAKAGESEKAFIDVVLQAAKDAVAANDVTVKSNASVADSYGHTAAVVTGSVQEVVDRIMDQMSAQRTLAGDAMKTSGTVVDAVERQVDAWGVAKDQMSLFAGEQAELAGQMQMLAFKEEEAYSAVADAATVSADRQVEAAAKAADAAEVNAGRQEDASVKSASASDAAAASAKRSADTQTKAFGASGSGLVTFGKRVLETAGVVAAGSLYMSARFEADMTKLQTQAGATDAQVHQMGQGILGMVGQVGQSPDHLAEGLYHIVSSMNAMLPPAHRSTEELKVLRVAAEGAAVGGTSMEETSYALASAMNTLHLRAGDAKSTMGDLNAIVGAGDMTMSDLMASLKSGVLPTAQAFGTSLQSLGGALAVFGDEGIRGAQAGTKLRMMFALLGGPTAKSVEILKAVGIPAGEVKSHFAAMTKALQEAEVSTTQMGEDLRKPDGLYVALSDLKTHLEESGLSATASAAVISRAFGGGRTGAGIMLLIQNLERLHTKYDQVGGTANKFGPDFAKTQETLSFQAKQAESAVGGLGVRLGQDLTPEAEEAMRGLREMAEWLDHNRTAAEALAGAIGVGLSVAVAAFTVNKLSKMVDGLKAASTAMSSSARWLVTPSGSGASNAAGAGGLASKEGQISGSRGVMMPGSMTNPIVVAQESGQYAGLGGEAAAEGAVAGSEGDVKTAEAEGKTASGVVPVAASATAEDAEAAGIMGTVKSGLGNIMRGGIVGIGGILASELAKTEIGGKTGKAVGAIGSDTAIGAAIGTAIEPGIGTAVGAALGGVAGLIKHLEGGTQAQQITESAAKGTDGSVRDHLQAGVENANKVAEKAIFAIEHQHEEFGDKVAQFLHEHSFGIIEGASKEKQGPDQRAEKREAEEHKQAQLYAAGKQFGAEHLTKEELPDLKGMSGVAQITGIITDTEKRFAKLPEAARQGALESIVAIVKEYQKDGKLPPTSVEELIQSIEGKFPALKQAFSGAGSESITALNQALKGQNVLSSIEGLVDQWRNVFPQLPHIVGLNLTNAEQTFSTVMAKMSALAHTGPESQRLAMSELYKKMHDEEIGYFSTMRGGIEGEIKHLSSSMGPLTASGTGAMETAYQRLVSVIRSEMTAGVQETGKGTEQINSILDKELKTLGLGSNTKTQKRGAAFGAGPSAPGGPGSTTLQPSGFTGAGKAQGGLIQLGHPGEAGKDTIPLSVGGQNIVAGAGETVAVFTRHQRAAAEAQLPGGLPGIFSNKKPNYMASGGFVAEPNTNFTAGYEPQIVADLRKLSAEMKEIVYGISGYRSPSHSVAVGGFSDDPHTEGKAADIGLGSPTLASMLGVPEADLRKVGLYRPFFPPDSAEANHVQLIGVPYGNNPGTPSGAGSSGSGGSAVARMVAQIATPKVGGTGVISQIAQAALSKVASAASTAVGAAGGTAGGSGGGGGSSPQNEALGKQMMIADGFPASEWSDLQKLWTKESGWSDTAVNPSSGAAGIAQSLGHGSVPLGNARAQIAWGLKYIKERYGNPTRAWAHEVSNNWYAEGGIVNAATGLEPKGTAKAKKKNRKKIPSKDGYKKTKGAFDIYAPKLSGALAPLKSISNVENLPEILLPSEKALEGLEAQQALLGQLEGDKQGTFILPGDMPYLQGAEGITAGMTTAEAKRINEVATQNVEKQLAKGSTVPLEEQQEELKYQAEVIEWAASQPSHRLLTPSDMGIVSGTFGPSGLSFPAKSGVWGDELLNAERQEMVLNTESTTAGYGIDLVKEAIEERHQRETTIKEVMHREYTRYTNLKGDIADLEVSQLKSRIKAAESTSAHARRVYDAEGSEEAIQEAINEERAQKKPDTQAIAQLEAQKAKLGSFVHSQKAPSSKVTSAQVELLKHELKAELSPIEQDLSLLGGSRTAISTSGGRYGQMAKDITTLSGSNGLGAFESLVSKIQESSLPTVKMSMLSIRQALEDSPVPVFIPQAHEAEKNSTLESALKEEVQQLGEKASIDGAQLSTFKNFIPQIPHYKEGGPVLDTGLAMVHKGEHVVPEGGTLVSTGGQAPVFHHKTDVHGDAAGLIKLIDSRVTRPANVRQIGQMQMRRTDLVRGRRR